MRNLQSVTSGILVLLAGALCSSPVAYGQDDVYFSIRKNFKIFGALYEELTAGYVEEIDPERLMRTGITSILETLDPYTTFINEAQTEDIDIRSRQRSGGVGLEVAVRDGRHVVTNPLEGYPAFDQGVRAGDRILTIDGRPVDGLSARDVGDLLGGDSGTTVEVVIRRPGESESIPFLLKRTRYRVRDVTYSGFIDATDGKNIGYVRLERFGQESLSGVDGAISNLADQRTLEGLILDLRDNPGGLLEAAVTVAGAFLPQNSLVVSTRGRSLEGKSLYRTRQIPIAPELPLIVLINGASASASEIVAGAVQDLDRGLVVGSRSFGKGLVQQIKSLPYLTALRMTTAFYYTPSGRSIQARRYGREVAVPGERVPDSLRNTFETEAGRLVRDGGGIEPDVEIEAPKKGGLIGALVRRSAFFRFAGTYAASVDSIPANFEVDDALLDAFAEWIDRQGEFTYQTDAERHLLTLRNDIAEREYRQAVPVLDQLEAAIRQEKARDFERDREYIREELRAALVARFHPESTRIATALAHDPYVIRAMELLNDTDTYNRLLAP